MIPESATIIPSRGFEKLIARSATDSPTNCVVQLTPPSVDVKIDPCSPTTSTCCESRMAPAKMDIVLPDLTDSQGEPLPMDRRTTPLSPHATRVESLTYWTTRRERDEYVRS